MNVSERIREECMPDRATLVARSEWTSYTTGWLRGRGVRFDSAQQAERAANGLTWTRWRVETGRISEKVMP